MEKQNKILRLCLADEQTKQMIEKSTLQLEIGGVVGDKYFGRENREVLLTSTYGYELALSHDIPMEYGTLGENILTDMNIKNLQLGERLKVGEVIFEVSMLCPVCTHLSVIKKELPKLIKNDRGIFLKVINGGTITLEDKIELL